jgi:hypothetical protein
MIGFFTLIASSSPTNLAERIGLWRVVFLSWIQPWVMHRSQSFHLDEVSCNLSPAIFTLICFFFSYKIRRENCLACVVSFLNYSAGKQFCMESSLFWISTAIPFQNSSIASVDRWTFWFVIETNITPSSPTQRDILVLDSGPV